MEKVSTTIFQILSRLGEFVQFIDENVEVSQKSAHNNQNIAASTEGQYAIMEEVASLSYMLLKMVNELQHKVKQFRL